MGTHRIITALYTQHLTARAVSHDLKDVTGDTVDIILVDPDDYTETVNRVTPLAAHPDNYLYILQPADNHFSFTSPALAAIYHTWSDKNRLKWIQPSKFPDTPGHTPPIPPLSWPWT
jgi:hypothetical protein